MLAIYDNKVVFLLSHAILNARQPMSIIPRTQNTLFYGDNSTIF